MLNLRFYQNILFKLFVKLFILDNSLESISLKSESTFSNGFEFLVLENKKNRYSTKMINI